MGLRNVVANAAEAAIRATGDIAVSSNYAAFVTTVVNVTTGAVSTTFATTAGVKVIFSQFRLREIDGSVVKPEDKRALLAATALASTPTVNDQIVTADETWNVQSFRTDPAGATYTLHVRRP